MMAKDFAVNHRIEGRHVLASVLVSIDMGIPNIQLSAFVGVTEMAIKPYNAIVIFSKK